MTFQAPAWLLLLIVVAALVGFYVLLQLRRKAYAARFTNVALLGSLVPKRPGWRRHLAFGLVALALGTLVVSLAVPSTTVRVPRERATVVIALDVSLSMQATDIDPSRFQAMQAAAKKFVDLLPPRINLGLVSFSGTASALVTPTTDHAQVRTAIDNLQLAESTAIGEAVFTSLTAITNFQSSLGSTKDVPPARVVLLSDGFNTVGRSDTQAIEAANAAHVPVSTIAFGTLNGTVTGDNGEVIPVPADDSALSTIAQRTGGSFHTAASVQQLESVYRDIGSQIGYTTERRDVSWRFLTAGLIATLLAAGASMLWAGRLT
jgi:Ca-activated chloride channel family protein